MSRLHCMAAGISEVAEHFSADMPAAIELPSETTEGALGLVIFENKGRRIMRGVTWGFRRLTREMRERGEEPGRIGLVADLTNPMWDQLAEDARYRCLIVLTHFANPDGVPGERTRTWFSLKRQPLMAWAGFCRNMPEQGPVYAGMTMEANEAVRPTNDRMPVLLDPHEYDGWLHGSIREVIGFQFRSPFSAERFRVEATEDVWRSGKRPPSADGQLALL
ncbi:hypothetical protein A7Q26_22190 [Sphingobium sp. TCM1]|nr:hypothetical protein A7Q26_22190 [Sphingobium sp. TCM1]